MSSSSSVQQQLPSLGDSWRRFRDVLSVSSVRVQAGTATHVFRVGRYSRVDGKVSPGECIESAFRAGGHKWKLLYYPNGAGAGHDDDDGMYRRRSPEHQQRGKVAVRLGLDGWFYTRATAEYRVSILDSDGRPAHSRAVPARRYHSGWYKTERDGFEVVATAAEQTSALRGVEDEGSLVVRCDVTVLNIKQESRLRFFLRQLWN